MPFKKGDPNISQAKKRRSPKPPPPIELALGRPSSYRPEYDETVKRLRLLMMTKEEIATFFGVAPNTLDLWGNKYPTFKNAYDDGGEKADAEVVAALRHRAIGYSHKAERIKITDRGDVFREEYTEHYPPDTAAASLWLSNRQRGKWKLKQPEEETNANINIKISGGLPDE